MRTRRSFFAAVFFATFLFAGCDSYSLLDKYSVAEDPEPEPDTDTDTDSDTDTPVELTLDVAKSTLLPGGSTELYPAGGTEPYKWSVLMGEYYKDGGAGTITGTTYTADYSIATVTIRLRDNAGTTKDAVITVIPPEPTSITVKKSGTGSLTVSWTYANTDYISGFKLFRSVNGAAATEIPITQDGLVKTNLYTYSLAAVAVSSAGSTYQSATITHDPINPD